MYRRHFIFQRKLFPLINSFILYSCNSSCEMKLTLPKRCYKTLQSLLRMWDVNIYKAFKISSLQSLEVGMSAAFIYLFITVTLNITTKV